MNYEDWHPSNKVCATIERLQYITIATPCQIKNNAASNQWSDFFEESIVHVALVSAYCICKENILKKKNTVDK